MCLEASAPRAPARGRCGSPEAGRPRSGRPPAPPRKKSGPRALKHSALNRGGGAMSSTRCPASRSSRSSSEANSSAPPNLRRGRAKRRSEASQSFRHRARAGLRPADRRHHHLLVCTRFLGESRLRHDGTGRDRTGATGPLCPGKRSRPRHHRVGSGPPCKTKPPLSFRTSQKLQASSRKSRSERISSPTLLSITGWRATAPTRNARSVASGPCGSGKEEAKKREQRMQSIAEQRVRVLKDCASKAATSAPGLCLPSSSTQAPSLRSSSDA